MVYKDSPAITNRVVIEAQWSDMPEEVVNEVRELWRDRELGNDYYYYTWSEDDFHDAESEEDDEDFSSDWSTYPVLAKWLRDNGVEAGCLIHFWW